MDCGERPDAITTGETNWEKQNDELISTYIPAKEILSNVYQFEAAYLKNNIDFDETYVDIITAAKIDINRGPNPAQRKKYLDQFFKDENRNFVFNFSIAEYAVELHEKYKRTLLKDVDFIVEKEDKIFFVEYKNSNIPNASNPKALW